jgi:NAD(P)H-dependent flavin oxidoreductase YrpB (nitropropane dioxygenase family)
MGELDLRHRHLPDPTATTILTTVAHVQRASDAVVGGRWDDRGMRTPLCDLLGIEFPIFAFSHCRDVVAAVSKAGGFGVLGAVAFSPEQLEVELDWIDEHVGDRPYGVDIIVPAKYTGIEQGGMTRSELAGLIPDEHRRFVDDVLARYGVDALPPDDASTSGRGDDVMSMSHESGHRLLEIVWAHPGVRLVANALGPAPDFLVAEAHERDVLVAGLVGTVIHAERQRAAGVDLVIAQGSEAGGHTGEIGTMVLVPQVVDAVAPTPVLAAGGIADGRQIAAALALGAQGVWCGSVWLTTEEAETHPVVKEKFLSATSADTLRSRSKTGKPARQLRSAWTDEWSDPANPDPLGMPLQMILVGEAEQRIARTAASNEGSRRLINYFVGQAVGMMNESKPATTVVFDLVEQYVDAAERIAATIAG